MSKHTHFVGHLDGKFYCLTCGPEQHADPLDGKGSDYDDYDCNGGRIECESCCEYVFPAEAAEQDAEEAAIMREVRRDAPIYRANALLAKQQADPVGFYLACKDDPDSIGM